MIGSAHSFGQCILNFPGVPVFPYHLFQKYTFARLLALCISQIYVARLSAVPNS